MPIQLDKILIDVAEEKVLHINFPEPVPKKDIDDAWSRVGRKNNLSVHEVRSIFKVLQKKYEQEKLKERSGWKLFPIMDEIHQSNKLDSADEEALPMEEDEEYEMLEVQEEEEQHPAVSSGGAPSGQAHSSGGEASDNETPTKSIKSESSHSGSPERFEKQSTVTKTGAVTTVTTTTSPREEKKLLNSLISPNSRIHHSTAAALQKKGITMKKAAPNGTNKIINNASTQQSKTISSNGHQILTIGKTIQLPDSLKRKLSEDQATPIVSKKSLLGQTVSINQSSQKGQSVESQNSNGANGNSNVQSDTSHHGINVITIPANDVNGSLLVNGSAHATLSDVTNGTLSPKVEEIDFRKDIIFDTGMCGDQISNATNTIAHIGNELSKTSKADSKKEEKILELGSSDSILPNTFFKNLCNSTRYESLGLYVANAMNRLDPRSASRLELNILRAIIDAQNDSEARK